MDTSTITGEYYLQGQREMASGFLFKPDNSFQFFFSYGALDRQGSGKWELQGNKLVLISTTKPSPDFTLVESKRGAGEGITIKMEKLNPALLRHTYCSLENGIAGTWSPMNGDGEIGFASQKIENICLLLEFCSERFATIPVDPDHTEFLFRMEPSIMEVYFNEFSLQLENGGLSGRHPLLEGDRFTYDKQ
jgi:hypothetical protein